MSEQKEDSMTFSKTKKEQFIDAVLGRDDEMNDELASSILAEYGIDESGLVDGFKRSIQEDLRLIPSDSSEAVNLRATVRKITEYQKASDSEAAEPKNYIADVFNSVRSAFQKPRFAFHNQKGELPESDKEILDELEKELSDEVE